MPLSKLGKKIKRVMIRHYGKKKGTQVFYAMEHSHPKWLKKRR